MDFQLTTLGISAAGPVPGRWASGQFLQAGGIGFLIDCGEGIQVALQKQGIGWSAIDVILISHLHGDHIYGLPGLLSSWGLNNRTSSLTIICPSGLKTILNAVFYEDFSTLGYPIHWVCTQTETVFDQVFENKHLLVSSLRLNHRIPTTGFLIKEKKRPLTILREAIEQYGIPYQKIKEIKNGDDFLSDSGALIPSHLLTIPPPSIRSFAYCSDTAPNPELIPYIIGVDILFHESTFLQDMIEQAGKSGHSTAVQAAQIAAQAKVGKLVLGHFSTRYKSLDVFLQEAKPIFDNTFLAKEGRVFDVPFEKRY